MTATMSNKNGRPSLAGQIDRLDGILDGLAEALNESVADAVRKTVGEEVRDAVESAVRDVLADPELIRAAVARHLPHTPPRLDEDHTPQKPTLRQSLASTLTWLVALAAGNTASAVRTGWSSTLDALAKAWRYTLSATRSATALVATMGGIAWSCKRAGTLALAVGAGVGVIAYLAGPLASSLLCGLGCAALTLAAAVLAPLWGLASGRD